MTELERLQAVEAEVRRFQAAVQPLLAATPPPPPPDPDPTPPPTTGSLFTCHMGAGMTPFIPAATPSWLPASSDTFEYKAFDQQAKWSAILYGCDTDRTTLTIAGSALHTVAADGPTVSKAPYTNNNYAALCLFPKFAAGYPILGDSIIRVSFKVDPHFGPRRWVELVAFDSRDRLIAPNETRNNDPRHALGPAGGQYFQWTIDMFEHSVSVRVPNASGVGIGQTWGMDMSWGQGNDRFNPDYPNIGRRPGSAWAKDNLNGTQALLGQPREFVLYLSKTHYRIEEGGFLIKQGAFTVPLAWESVNFAFIHMAYHLSLEHQEMTTSYPEETVFLGQSAPYSDTRVWDDFDIEYVAAIPV